VSEAGVKPQQRRYHGAHYHPRAQFRSDDASQHANSLMHQLGEWCHGALAGERRHRLTATNSKLIARSVDELLGDCAWVLANAQEWEGALMAHLFATRGWPVDVELVRLCHQWSCSLMDRVMAQRRASAPRF